MVQVVLEAEAAAEATALKGEAEAYAIEAKAKAEAEQMAKKADAWKEYKEAAMVDMMLQTLPKVSRSGMLLFPSLNICVRWLPRWPLRSLRQRRSRWSATETGKLEPVVSPGRSSTSW